MALTQINKGAAANDGSGTPARTAADIINANDLYLEALANSKASPEDLAGYAKLTDLYRPTAIIDKNYYHVTGYQYKVVRVRWVEDAVENDINFNQDITLAAADGTFDRIDYIVLNVDTDLIYKKDGTAAATAAPPVLEANEYMVFFVLVSAASSAPIGLVNTDLYKENAQEVGGEYDTTVSGAVVSDAVTDPAAGTYHIAFTAASNGANINLAHSVPLAAGAGSLIMKFKQPTSHSFRFNIVAYNGATAYNLATSVQHGNYGLDTSITATYQDMVIPLNPSQAIDSISIVNTRNGSTIYFDEIIIQKGSSTPVNTGVEAADVTLDTTNFNGVLSPADDTVQKALETLDNYAPGSGDMLAALYDPTAVGGDAFAMDNMVEGATTKILTAAERAKLGFIAITQAVDLDAIETRVNELDAAVVLKGGWDASAGTFPGSGTAQAGHSYQVTVAGTVDGVQFSVNDRIIAILDNASTVTYIANWLKADYSDIITSLDAQTGALTLGSVINSLTAKTTPVDADAVPLSDSAAGNASKKLTWANIKATLKTYFDTLYNLYAHPNHSGDVTSVADGATTIAANVVSNAKLATVATATIKGRVTAATGNVEDLTAAQVKTVLAYVPTDIKDRLEEDAAVTGTKNIDWGSYETFKYTLTAACVFSDTNLPATGTKTITIHMNGAFAPTYPAGWSTYIRGAYDGTVRNLITIEYVKAGTPFYVVDISQPD